MKHIFLFLLSLVVFQATAQTIVDPSEFPTLSSPTMNNWAIYTREDKVNRKVLPSAIRALMLPIVRQPADITYTPAATGNANDKGSFVKTPSGRVYFIDGLGNSIQSNFPYAAATIADNDIHAGVMCVPVGGWYRLSNANTLGLPPGTLRQRVFGSLTPCTNTANPISPGQTKVVGGGGLIKTNGDPDTNPYVKAQDQWYEASVAYDTVARQIYTYNSAGTLGNRWDVFEGTGIDTRIDTAYISTDTLRLVIRDIIGDSVLKTIKVPVVANVSITAGTGIGVSGTSPNFTVTNTAPLTTGDKGDITVGTLTTWAVDANTIDSTRLQANSVQSSDIRDGQVWLGDLATNSVDSTKIKPNAVGTGEIRDATILFQDLAQNGATTGQVPKWNGSTWAPAADDNTGGGGGSISRTARGDSISVGTTKVRDYDNPQNNGFYLRNNLKYTDIALSKINATTGSMSLVLLGDSYIEQEIFPNEFKKLFQEKMVMGGPGFLQAKDLFRYPSTAASTNSLAANGWTLRTMLTTPLGKGLSIHSVISTVSSTPFYWLPQSQKSTAHIWNTLELWYYGQPGGATLTVEIDGVNVGSVNTSTLSGFQRATFTVATNKQHSVKVTASGAGAEILGFNCYTASATNVKIHAFGQNGAKASHYLAVDTSLWNPQFRTLAPNLVVVNLGTNNRAAGQSLSAFKTEMKSFVQMLKHAKRDIDICLLGQVDLSASFGSPVFPASAYNEILREIAIEDSLSYFDTDQVYGSYLERTQTSKGALIGGDGIHPTAAGGYVTSNAFINAVVPFDHYNLVEGNLRTYGFTNPAASTGYTPNRIPVINTDGTLVTDNDFQIDVVNQSVILQGNISSANATVASVLTVNSPPLGGNGLKVGGTSSSIQYFGFASGQNLLAAGYTQGIRCDGTSSPVIFQTSNQGSVTDNWLWQNFAGSAALRDMTTTGRNIFRINQGVANMNNGQRNDIFVIDSEISNANAVTTTHLGGITFRPTITSLNGIILQGFENTVGHNYFNSTSGYTAIGLSSTGASVPVRTLHVAGETRITDLTTDTPTRFVGADADGDLNEITLGTGFSITSNAITYTPPAGSAGIYGGSGSIPSGGSTVTATDANPLIFTSTATSGNPFRFNMTQGGGVQWNNNSGTQLNRTYSSSSAFINESATRQQTIQGLTSVNLIATDGVKTALFTVRDGGYVAFPTFGTFPAVTGDNKTGWNSTLKKIQYMSSSDVKTVANKEDDFKGLPFTIRTADFTLGATNIYSEIVDANSGAVVVTLDASMEEGKDFTVKCRRNATNTVTFTAGGANVFEIDGLSTIAPTSLVVGGIGIGIEAPYKIYTIRRSGTNIFIK